MGSGLSKTSARLGCALGLALACATSGQRAARADDAVAADALFRAGRNAMKAGDWAGACAKFEESYALDRAPGTLLNLGECKDKLGLYASAWQHYREAAEALTGDDRRAIALKGQADAEPKVPHLTVALGPGAPPSARVRRDKTPLGAASLGVALPVDPGDHVVVVEADGRATTETRVHLEPAESKSVVVSAGAIVEAPVAKASPLRPIGFVAAGLGVASLGVGIATGLVTMSKKSIVDQECDRGVCSDKGVSAASSGKTLSAVSTATFVGGGALVAIGVVLVLVGHPTTEPGAPLKATGALAGGRASASIDASGLEVRF